MVEHRRTPSRRPYSLPGWFFVVTAFVCVLGLAGIVWAVTGDRTTSTPQAAEPTPSAATSAVPGPKTTQPAPDRPTITVEILNASGTPGLAAEAAKEAEKAGWKVANVGNWQYGATHEAVYYPAGEEDAAKMLADDLKIDSVEPAKEGMAINQLTVLVLN